MSRTLLAYPEVKRDRSVTFQNEANARFFLAMQVKSDLPLEIVMYFFVVKKVLRILPSWHISKLLIQLVLQ